jgi:hypothetical protein
MSGDTTIVFGVPVPSTDPVFLAVVRFHIVVGIACVLAGVAAMLSEKRRGRHSRFGTLYYWCLAVVVASATGLSVARWAENYHLFTLGMLSLIAATVARTALRRRWVNWVRLHITGMGLSYILMLTAFYVDNGKNQPLWRELPQLAFWLLPAALGIPIIVHTLLRRSRGAKEPRCAESQTVQPRSPSSPRGRIATNTISDNSISPPMPAKAVVHPATEFPPPASSVQPTASGPTKPPR